MQHCYYPVTKRTIFCSLKCILKTTLTTNNNASKTTNLITSLFNNENNENEETSSDCNENISNKESNLASKMNVFAINGINNSEINNDINNSMVVKNDANECEYNNYEISKLFSLFFFDHLNNITIKKSSVLLMTKKHIERNFLENPKQCYCLVA